MAESNQGNSVYNLYQQFLDSISGTFGKPAEAQPQGDQYQEMLRRQREFEAAQAQQAQQDAMRQQAAGNEAWRGVDPRTIIGYLTGQW